MAITPSLPSPPSKLKSWLRSASPLMPGDSLDSDSLPLKKTWRVGAQDAQRMFKKVDSVLRGPVAAEIEAALDGLGLDRAVLVPANPSRGRIIRDGAYFMDGVPLDETEFADDPMHPVRCARC